MKANSVSEIPVEVASCENPSRNISKITS